MVERLILDQEVTGSIPVHTEKKMDFSFLFLFDEKFFSDCKTFSFDLFSLCFLVKIRENGYEHG